MSIIEMMDAMAIQIMRHGHRPGKFVVGDTAEFKVAVDKMDSVEIKDEGFGVSYNGIPVHSDNTLPLSTVEIYNAKGKLIERRLYQ